MTVWATAPVEEDPEIVLVRWHVFATGAGNRHFCGYNRSGREGRVSSRIETFDHDRMTGRTASGRVYRLEGPPGMDPDALYVRARWWAMGGKPGEPAVVDVLSVPGSPSEQQERVVQEWQGYVLKAGTETFTCRLVDLTAGSTVETEEAEIPLSEVPEAERALVRDGAYFKWAISDGPTGTSSAIDFASTPVWTEAEIEAAKARGAELHRFLNQIPES